MFNVLMGFQTIIYYPLTMENKSSAASPGLSTINIAYSMRTHDPSTTLRRRQEAHLQFSLPRPSHPSSKQPPSPIMQEQQETAFNDSSLKYGKSQTLKEAVFNRLRIPIYRRSKKPKWLQLPNSDDHAPLPDPPRESEHRQNKTSLNNRNQPTPIRRKQLKTSSSEEGRLEKVWRQGGLGKFEMVDSEKLNSFIRALIEGGKGIEKPYSRRFGENEGILRRKSQKISYPLHTLAKRSFAIKKLFSPPRLPPQEKDSEAGKQTIDRDQFDAWDNSDLFGSNRNGIVEYTEQYVNPESLGRAQESAGDVFSSKKRRRFIIRDMK